jgi:prepilin-type N-terminal cleavage/methylation domain-containing protein
MKLMKKNKGFTLIELLVVVAIIGMLASTIAVGFSSTRRKSRDTKRLSDMTQLAKGLEVYYSSATGYPDEAVWLSSLVSNTDIQCNGVSSFRPIEDAMPGYSYTYYVYGDPLSGCGGTVWSDYYIRFVTEGPTDIGPAGTYYMTPRGFMGIPPESTSSSSSKKGVGQGAGQGQEHGQGQGLTKP